MDGLNLLVSDSEDQTKQSEIVKVAYPCLPTDFLQLQKWLQSADGGLKCEKSAKQHCQQTSVTFKAVDDALENISSLWNTLLLKKFLTDHVVEKQFAPKTIKSYLSSLCHWYCYI